MCGESKTGSRQSYSRDEFASTNIRVWSWSPADSTSGTALATVCEEWGLWADLLLGVDKSAVSSSLGHLQRSRRPCWPRPRPIIGQAIKPLCGRPRAPLSAASRLRRGLPMPSPPKLPRVPSGKLLGPWAGWSWGNRGPDSLSTTKYCSKHPLKAGWARR